MSSSPASQGFHDRAVIISSGDEIITGQLLDTNARFFAKSLVDKGILPAGFVTVPDERAEIAQAIRSACAKAPLVILSGGLGPTDGDLTRHALADAMEGDAGGGGGEALVIDDDAKLQITAMLEKRGRPVTERQLRQAYRPTSASCLPNAFGTAPGLHAVVRVDGRASDVFCLPGPPGELRPMWATQVLPRLRLDPSRVVMTRLLHIVGVPEAEAVQRLGDLTKRTRMPLVGITASGGILTLRIRWEGSSGSGEGASDHDAASAARSEIESAERQARAALGDHIFAVGDAAVGTGVDFLARTVLKRLASREVTNAATSPSRGESLSVVESCTGGSLGGLITSIPGSSAQFVGGAITYSNELKIGLGVDAAIIREYGAVSRPCARAMAIAGLERFGTAHCLSITGVAGPDGGSTSKPVGTVYVARASRSSAANAEPMVDVRRFHFTGDREDVRQRASVTALAMLYCHLAGHDIGQPKLLWQVEEPA